MDDKYLRNHDTSYEEDNIRLKIEPFEIVEKSLASDMVPQSSQKKPKKIPNMLHVKGGEPDKHNLATFQTFGQRSLCSHNGSSVVEPFSKKNSYQMLSNSPSIQISASKNLESATSNFETLKKKV